MYLKLKPLSSNIAKMIGMPENRLPSPSMPGVVENCYVSISVVSCHIETCTTFSSYGEAIQKRS